MPDQLITCPNCRTEFEVGNVLTDSIRTQLRAELEADIVKKQEDVTKRLNDAKRLEKELAERAEAIDDAIAEQLEAERKKVALAVRQRVEKELKGQLEDLQEQVEERGRKLEEANKKELDLLKRQRELQEKEQSIDLEIERRLQEAQKGLFVEAMRKAQEHQQLEMRKKDDLIKGLQGQMQQLQQRIEQGSQESQGEALEGQLRDNLRDAFPFDTFDEVKKGASGADIVQTVCDRQARVCGIILWEAKNAKKYQKDWLDKLKHDQIEAGAAIAVLMTVALPGNIKRFGQSEDGGVWITDYASAVGLCSALRQQLIIVMREKIVLKQSDAVKDLLYNYVTGQKFNMRVRAVADAYIQMQKDLESEKLALRRIWKRREKQIEKVLNNIGDMRGELEDLVDGQASLPDLEPLGLEHIASDENLDEEEVADEAMSEEQAEDGDDAIEGETDDDQYKERGEAEVQEVAEEKKPAKDPGKWWAPKKDPFFRE